MSLEAEPRETVVEQLLITNPSLRSEVNVLWKNPQSGKSETEQLFASGTYGTHVSNSIFRQAQNYPSEIEYKFEWSDSKSHRIEEKKHVLFHDQGAFYPEMAFADWRGFGMNNILLLKSDWDLMEPAERQALMDWVHLGGRLEFYDGMPESSADFRKHLGPDWRPLAKDLQTRATVFMGQGWVRPFLPKPKIRDGKVIPTARDEEFMKRRGRDEYLFNPKRLRLGNQPIIQLPSFDREFPLWLLISLVLLFSTVLGPVNMLVFARGSKRYRMLITTPILAVLLGLLLILVILVTDGPGVKGNRVSVIELCSTDQKSYVTQHHAVRTNLPLRTSFDLPGAELGQSVILPNWSRAFEENDYLGMSRSPFHMPNHTVYKKGRVYGDWFRSRKNGLHIVRSLRPTRARMECVKKDGPPVLHSHLEADLIACFLLDENNRYWKVEGGILRGERKIPCRISWSTS